LHVNEAETSGVAEPNEQSVSIHLTGQDLRNDRDWINKLAQYVDHDPEVFEIVRDHLKQCMMCGRVIDIWERRRERSSRSLESDEQATEETAMVLKILIRTL
jgi:hypothetical protein